MTPRVERIYHDIFYSNLKEYEVKQLVVGLMGMMLNAETFRSTAETTVTYKLDEETEDEDL